MRTFLLRRLWFGLTVTGLLLAASGCKSSFSPPSMDWLSWGKKKPSVNNLSSSTPQRPSSSTLPSPSATMGSSGQATAGANPLTSTAPAYSASSRSAPAGGTGGYYTGPYNTGQTAGASPGAMTAGSFPPSNGSGSAATYGGSAGSGYQSPYAGTGGGYRTADTRSGFTAAGASQAAGNPYANPAGSAPQSWNADQWRRDAGASNAGPVAPTGYGNSPPASGSGGYSADAAGNLGRGYGSATQAWNSQPGASYQSGASAAAPAGAINARPGAYRPGSTSRNAGTLGTPSYDGGQATYGAAPNSAAGYGGGAGSNDAAGNPPGQPSSYGGAYSYPSTGQ